MFVGHSEYRVCEPASEGIVVLELLKELGVVFKERGDDAFERLIVLDPSVLTIGVLLGVLTLFIMSELSFQHFRHPRKGR